MRKWARKVIEEAGGGCLDPARSSPLPLPDFHGLPSFLPPVPLPGKFFTSPDTPTYLQVLVLRSFMKATSAFQAKTEACLSPLSGTVCPLGAL